MIRFAINGTICGLLTVLVFCGDAQAANTREDLEICKSRFAKFRSSAQIVSHREGEGAGYPPAFSTIYQLWKDSSILLCPLDKTPTPLADLPILKTSYLRFDRFYEASQTKIPREQLPLYYDKEGTHPGGRYVLFADGKIQWVKEKDLQTLLLKINTAIDEGIKHKIIQAAPIVSDEDVFPRARYAEILKSYEGLPAAKVCEKKLATFYEITRHHVKYYPDESEYPPDFFDLYYYTKDEQALLCSLDAHPTPVESFPVLRTSFVRFAGVAQLRKAKVKDRDIPLFFDKPGTHPGGRYVLFNDGTVRWLTEEAFQAHLKKLVH